MLTASFKLHKDVQTTVKRDIERDLIRRALEKTSVASSFITSRRASLQLVEKTHQCALILKGAAVFLELCSSGRLVNGQLAETERCRCCPAPAALCRCQTPARR